MTGFSPVNTFRIFQNADPKNIIFTDFKGILILP